MTDNPPAFPVATEHHVHAHGMSLRDWFATHAPAEIPYEFMRDQKPNAYSTKAGEPWDGDAYAAAYGAELGWQFQRMIAWRWHYADAMLAERAKQ